MTKLLYIIFVTIMLGCSDSWADEKEYFRMTLNEAIHEVSGDNHGKSGAYIFEKGEEALLARGWLTDHATETIDVQYFIWSTDNIGILAAEALLRAAGRGVKVRVLVDDLLIDAPDKIMLSLNAHPNIDIRIYNPKHSVGISILERFWHLLFNFRSANQRMHDKTFTVDNRVSITGGRNMADEYFDYNQIYNFRDRDTLLIGPVVDNVKKNFSTFWTSNLAIPVETILNKEVVTPLESEREKIYKDLHDYASNSKNFETAVRSALHDLHKKFSLLAKAMTWGDVRFIHDVPGKNASTSLTGGSETFDQLVRTVSEAKERIVIQSPYLIMPKDGIKFFKKLIDRGVKVQISTNSLASTDNLQAFSGYSKQRKKILAAGIEVFEFKPNPKIQQELIERYEALKKSIPTFAIHAKTLVIDGEVLFVGTFNLDPRSANLNTEVGVIIKNRNIAIKVEQSILKDMLPENSWNTAKDKPDSHASFTKKIKMYFWRLWPLDRIL